MIAELGLQPSGRFLQRDAAIAEQCAVLPVGHRPEAETVAAIAVEGETLKPARGLS